MTPERESSVLTERARAALARMARERAERAKKDGGNGKGDEGAASHGNAKRTGGKASAAASEPEGVTLNDFVAYMPGHLYICTLTREMWPAASVNARVGNVAKDVSASAWLEQPS